MTKKEIGIHKHTHPQASNMENNSIKQHKICTQQRFSDSVATKNVKSAGHIYCCIICFVLLIIGNNFCCRFGCLTMRKIVFEAFFPWNGLLEQRQRTTSAVSDSRIRTTIKANACNHQQTTISLYSSNVAIVAHFPLLRTVAVKEKSVCHSTQCNMKCTRLLQQVQFTLQLQQFICMILLEAK